MGRKAGVPNKITSEIKDRLATILNEAIDSIDVKTLTIKISYYDKDIFINLHIYIFVIHLNIRKL